MNSTQENNRNSVTYFGAVPKKGVDESLAWDRTILLAVSAAILSELDAGDLTAIYTQIGYVDFRVHIIIGRRI